MGRELRMVPPNWQHPEMKNGRGSQPMHSSTFEEVAKEWKDGFAAWERGEKPDYCTTPNVEYWEYNGAPPDDRAYYRPWKTEDATWFQLWENVSEGTPVTPPFATKEELIEYLVTKGCFWDDGKGWSRKAAENVVNGGYAPSMIIAGGVVYRPGDDVPEAPK